MSSGCSEIRVIIFGSHAQLKKLDPYLPVRIFGNFMHPAVVVKNLGVWFDAKFSFADHVRNICKKCFIQIRDLRLVRKHLTDEAAILAANALVTSCLEYCNSLFRSLSFSTCANYSLFKTHLLGLPQTVTNTHRHLLFSNYSIGSQLNFTVSESLVYKFLHKDQPSYFGPLLSTHCGRYSTRYKHSDKRFLEVPQFCPSVHT